MAKAIHTMIRVLDEARSVDFYRQALGLEIAERFPFDGFTLVYLRNSENDFEVELTINHDRKEPYGHADGYGHLAVCVEDLWTPSTSGSPASASSPTPSRSSFAKAH